MTIPSSRGHLSFAVQSAKIGDGTFTPGSLTWQRHTWTDLSFGVNEMVRESPPEIGGGLFPSGTYKVGVSLQGGATLEPRLKGSLGHLLYAAAGNYQHTAASGAQSPIHTFRVDPTDPAKLPWIAFRKYVPAANNAGTDGQTEYGVDCRVTTLTLQIPQASVLSAQVGFVGRRPIAVDGESATGPAYEDASSLALSCKTTVSLTDFASYLPGGLATGGKFTGAEIGIDNGFTAVEDEMILGSYYADDFMPLQRRATVRLFYKSDDNKLYRHMLYGAAVSGQREWTPVIARSPVTVTALSANNVSGTYTHPFRLIFSASTVEWRVSPIVLTPNRMIIVELMGTVVTPDTGPAWQIELHNAATYPF